MSDLVHRAQTLAEKAAVAERAGILHPEPPADPVQPVLAAARHVPMPEPLAERLRGLPAELLAELAGWVARVWWAGWSTRRTKGWRR